MVRRRVPTRAHAARLAFGGGHGNLGREPAAYGMDPPRPTAGRIAWMYRHRGVKCNCRTENEPWDLELGEPRV